MGTDAIGQIRPKQRTEKQRRSNGAVCFGMVLLGIGLASCERLDTTQLEADLTSELEQGGIALESVTCPRGVPLRAGESFQCEVEPSSGEAFTVVAEQQDENGTITWEIPNSKKVLNLTRLETYFQREIAGETQSAPVVVCGEARYRLNKPGDRFECEVMNATTASQEEIERIIVQINARSDVDWQQVRRSSVAALPSESPAPSAAPASGNEEPTASSSPEPANSADPSPSDTRPAPTATSTTADDFLSDPSVFEDF
ncbi:hypothetical protein C7B61_01520 [filamentous cyanobacterium CCP1]|nr:hypothetical protein C7B61_01520 [filamentous cyanobacterium CCP1]